MMFGNIVKLGSSLIKKKAERFSCLTTNCTCWNSFTSCTVTAGYYYVFVLAHSLKTPSLKRDLDNKKPVLIVLVVQQPRQIRYVLVQYQQTEGSLTSLPLPLLLKVPAK